MKSVSATTISWSNSKISALYPPEFVLFACILEDRDHSVPDKSEAGAQNIRELGAGVAFVSAFDAAEVERALRETEAEVVIDELTSLPRAQPTWPLPRLATGS